MTLNASIQDLDRAIHRRNLRYCWQTWHPLERWKLEAMAKREWGNAWHTEIEKED